MDNNSSGSCQEQEDEEDPLYYHPKDGSSSVSSHHQEDDDPLYDYPRDWTLPEVLVTLPSGKYAILLNCTNYLPVAYIAKPGPGCPQSENSRTCTFVAICNDALFYTLLTSLFARLAFNTTRKYAEVMGQNYS